MNCKPNERAVMVRSNAGNEGKIVTCLRIATHEELYVNCFSNSHGPVWFVDVDLPLSDGGVAPLAVDSFIRPLRDSDGEDEMIRIAGLPHKEIA